jgi:protein phosphatase PTC1
MISLQHHDVNHFVNSRNGTAVRLSYDHKISDPEETQRVKNANCFILNGRLGGNQQRKIRFSYPLGSLAISRAFGDIDYKNAGLIADPYVTETVLSPTDTHLIIACDGVRICLLL